MTAQQPPRQTDLVAKWVVRKASGEVIRGRFDLSPAIPAQERVFCVLLALEELGLRTVTEDVYILIRK